jgi:hypothetical protein
MGRLGDILLSTGALSAAALQRALSAQPSTGGRLGTVLLEQGVVSEETLARALAKLSGREYAHWSTVRSAPRSVVELLPAKIAIRAGAVPFERTGRVLKVAMRDPIDLAAEDEIAFVTGRKIETRVLAEVRLLEALERFYGLVRTPRMRLLSERLDRIASSSQERRRTPAPSPPPPALGAASAESSFAAGPFAARSEAGEEIEIASWKPGLSQRGTPFPIPAPAPPIPELEFTLEERSAATPAPSATPAAVRERMLGAETRDDIAEAVLDRLGPEFALVALFIARKSDVIGWNARGEGLSRTRFRALRFPSTEPSLLLTARLSGIPYRGMFTDLPAHGPLFEAIGRKPARVAILPVSLGKRVVAMLMVDPGESDLSPSMLRELGRLAEDMAEAFGRLILAQRRPRGAA